jgi:acyl-CoA thioester hydrolase
VLITGNRRVSMADTDAAGVLYFGAPYPWHEAAMMEWLNEAGHPINVLLSNGEAFPCVHSAAEYRAPLRVNDALRVVLLADGAGRTSFGLRSEYWRSSDLCVEVRSRHVWTLLGLSNPTAAVRPDLLPDWLRSALS